MRKPEKYPGFTGVDVSGGIDLYLSSGPASVSISASTTEIRDHIVTEVVHGVLRISPGEKLESGDRGNSKMKAYVSLNKLKSLEASGGGDIFLKGLITADDLTCRFIRWRKYGGKVKCQPFEYRAIRWIQRGTYRK